MVNVLLRTEVRLGRKTDREPMVFLFDSPIEAYEFYCIAKENYAEDDFIIEME